MDLVGNAVFATYLVKEMEHVFRNSTMIPPQD